MSYKFILTTHSQAIVACMHRFGLQGRLDFKTHHLQVIGYQRQLDLWPRFMEFPDGVPSYTEAFGSHTAGFVGWLPYTNRQWDWALEKKRFKAFCYEQGLLTPTTWPLTQEPDTPYLFKTNQSSFSQDILGPYHPGRPPHCAPDMRHPDNEYYTEAFIAGRLAKAWFVEDQFSCLEITDMPSVTGDGEHNIKQLILSTRPQIPMALQWQDYEIMLSFQGLTLENVLGVGEAAITDFRLSSALRSTSLENKNVAEHYRDTTIGEQYAQVGKVVWPHIPEPLRQNIVYSVDGVIDADDRLWLLELNSCPALHPDIYADMFARFFELDPGMDVSKNPIIDHASSTT